MRVLFAIPHFYRPVGFAPDGRPHGAFGHNPQPRIDALTACLKAIQELCQPRVCVLSHVQRYAQILPGPAIQAEVVVCTTGDHHLLGSLPAAITGWKQRSTTADPPLLGFECHTVLAEGLGNFDYYCYLEDDILLRDPWFFRKLEWFRSQFGDQRILQPNRFESGSHPFLDRMYIDGDLPLSCTSPFQAEPLPNCLASEILGQPVLFRTTSNPHAGCFFLSQSQLAQWVESPHFRDRSTTFIGALESAASLGIMRTFHVFKPGIENMDFFEVQHFGTAYLNMVTSRLG